MLSHIYMFSVTTYIAVITMGYYPHDEQVNCDSEDIANGHKYQQWKKI